MKSAIASVSLGRASAGHSLQAKIAAASKAGFEGIELFWECFSVEADKHPGSTEYERNIATAHLVAGWCSDAGIKVFVLQPFAGYDGVLDQSQHADLIEKARHWFELCGILGCTHIQVPANYLEPEEVSADDEVIAKDLRELCDLAPAGMQVCYEFMAWSTVVDTWPRALRIIRLVDRPNINFCFDTFHCAGRSYGDPTTTTGVLPEFDSFAASMEEFGKTVTLAEIGYVQLSDASKMDPPLPENKLFDPTQRSRMNWSRTSRLFPYEEELGGYLPIDDQLRALAQIGFEGWYSHEIFNVSLYDTTPDVPSEHARRGMLSWLKVQEKVESYKRAQ